MPLTWRPSIFSGSPHISSNSSRQHAVRIFGWLKPSGHFTMYNDVHKTTDQSKPVHFLRHWLRFCHDLSIEGTGARQSLGRPSAAVPLRTGGRWRPPLVVRLEALSNPRHDMSHSAGARHGRRVNTGGDDNTPFSSKGRSLTPILGSFQVHARLTLRSWEPENFDAVNHPASPGGARELLRKESSEKRDTRVSCFPYPGMGSTHMVNATRRWRRTISLPFDGNRAHQSIRRCPTPLLYITTAGRCPHLARGTGVYLTC